MKNAIYPNTVDTRQQLWQPIQDGTNEIHATAGVFERPDARVHDHAEKMLIMCWATCNKEILPQ
jgi:hypothetical protein